MASFSATVITTKGHSLMAKIQAGTANPTFTQIKVSDTDYSAYTQAQKEALTSISGVKQLKVIADVSKVNASSVKVSSVVDNVSLATGYYLKTIGLYAMDPSEGEILYSVTTAVNADWIPPNTGISVTSIIIDLITTVSNSDNVSVAVDPNATATVQMVNDLNDKISDLQGFVGYTDEDIFGVEVDFTSRTFKRLAAAVNKLPGVDFDSVQLFGGRKRCNVNNEGVIIAYHGDAAYTETGTLLQEVTINEVTYPVGEKVQVMVEQPKFYYKVVPLELDKVVDGKGFHMRKARYYVSDVKKSGFKLHPAFIHNGKEKNFIYLSAYEGSLYDVSVSDYILDDAQIADFTVTDGDMLSSIANTKPISGLTQDLTRAKTRIIANNRGSGWEQAYAATISATMMLFAVEYASFNTQNAIGYGVLNKASGAGNESELTGATTNLGNASGSVTNVNGYNVPSYRGEENWWGNIWKWIDGLNIFNQSDLYVSDHGFTDDVSTDPYEDAGITIAKVNGYISAFAYNESFDWLFFPSETVGDSSLPVGDYLYQTTTLDAWRVARLGGDWYYSSSGGGFYWSVTTTSSNRYRSIGGRLVYVPDAA